MQSTCTDCTALDWTMPDPNVRAVWEDSLQQIQSVFAFLRKYWIKCFLAALILYGLFALGGTLFYLDQYGLVTREDVSKQNTRVILLTYMRSGSTFTSELFQSHPDVFFQFEPLHMVWYYKSKVYSFLKKVRRLHFRGEFWRFTQQMKLDTMYHVMRCSFEEVDIASLLQYHWIYSKSTLDYKHCTNRHEGVIGLEHCLPLLTSACSKAKVNLIKTINFTTSEAEMFMYPDVKLIHLVRDPRATIWSHMKFKAFLPRNLNLYSRIFCDSVLSNVQGYAKLKTRFPDRVTFVRYEDIARSPVTYTQRLYDFVGLSMTRDVYSQVMSITSGVRKDNCSVCVFKANSSVAAEAWRREAVYQFVRVVDANCKHLYSHIGYLLVSSPEMLINTSISLRTAPMQHALLV